MAGLFGFSGDVASGIQTSGLINMEKSVQLGENYPIHAYLSYRCKIGRDIATRDQLEKICRENSIALKFDQNSTKEGDSIDKFMEDLTSARCVFLFLSPEYFQSAYTLYELIRIHEQTDLDKRFIFPIRLTDSMVEKFRTEAKKDWFNKQAEADRDLLADKLKQSDIEILWQRIDSAWEAIVKPYLGELHPSMESGNSEQMLRSLLFKSCQKVQEIIDEDVKKLHEKVSREIENILKHKNIPLDQIAVALKIDASANLSEIAQNLLKDKKIGETLAVLYKLSKQQEKQLSSRADKWKQYLFDIEQLCGWLLLTTIDHSWWFQNQLNVKSKANKRITSEFSLQQPAYVEVIISRDLLQRAQLDLDQFGSLKPASEEHNVSLFDAISQDASAFNLLTPLYKDLRRTSNAPQDLKRLLQDIELTARSLYEFRDKKSIYYLVSKDYLLLLKKEPWFNDFELKLAGCLQFVCVNKSQDSDQAPCQEDQRLLLEQVANILRLKNKKENNT
jgi:hypothetical protein